MNYTVNCEKQHQIVYFQNYFNLENIINIIWYEFQKYLQPLKSPENAGLVDAATVDEIFYQVSTMFTSSIIFIHIINSCNSRIVIS